MLKTILPLALLVALLAGASAAHADTLREPLDFHGNALGSPLDQIRRQGHSDKTLGDVHLICVGDRLARESGKDFDPGDNLVKAGVRVCKFIQRTSGKWEEAFFQVGRHKLLALFYFTPRTGDPATSERLYHISAGITPATYDDIAAAVKGQYGEPETDSTVPVRDRTGKLQEARVMGWLGARGSVVVIKDRVDDLDMGGLTYVDHDLAKAVGGKPKAGEAGALPSPFGLRGFNLGTTLGEIRQRKHPDGAYAEFVCTGDPRATEQFGLTPGELYRAIGVKTCRFFIFRESHGDVLEMAMDVDGHPSRAIFLFTPSTWPPSTANRLFTIRVVADPAQFDRLFGALQARFGKPGIDEMIPQENSKRLSRTLIWEDSQSKLSMSESMPSASGDRTIIAYVDLALEDAVEKAIEASKNKPGAGRR